MAFLIYISIYLSEYNFPGNCYSEEKDLGRILLMQQQAHEMIGAAGETATN
jgi:hypothetical protein